MSRNRRLLWGALTLIPFLQLTEQVSSAKQWQGGSSGGVVVVRVAEGFLMRRKDFSVFLIFYFFLKHFCFVSFSLFI